MTPAIITAGMVSDAVLDAINTAQDWVVAKISWVIPTIWIWYGWGGIAFAVLLLIGFFLPFKWVRAGLGVVFALIVAYIAGGRHMGQIKDDQAAKSKKKSKPAEVKKPDGWSW